MAIDSDWAIACAIYFDEPSSPSSSAPASPRLCRDASTGLMRGTGEVRVNGKQMIVEELADENINHRNNNNNNAQTAADRKVSSKFNIDPEFAPLWLTVSYEAEDLWTVVQVEIEAAPLYPREIRPLDRTWLRWLTAQLDQLKCEGAAELIRFLQVEALGYFQLTPVETGEVAGTFMLARVPARVAGLRFHAEHSFMLSEADAAALAFDTHVSPVAFGPYAPGVFPPRFGTVPSCTPSDIALSTPTAAAGSSARPSSTGTHASTSAATLVAACRRAVALVQQFDCTVCLDTTPAAEAVRLYCGHVFCATCIIHYVAIAAADFAHPRHRGTYPFECPRPDCRLRINDDYDETLVRLLPAPNL
ncbi:hypothetical protein DFJ73DRAFT_959559, partial [Zopfochytrium polystomum]